MNIIEEILRLPDMTGVIKARKRPVLLYGMGNGAELTDAYLRSRGIIPDGVFASDGFVRGQSFMGKRVLSVAEAGAGVLHPDAVSILLTGKTDIHLKNTFHPDSAGTRISNRTDARVSCIAYRATERKNQMEISVFYPPEAMLQYIYSEMNPIHIIHMRDRIRIIVPNVKVADSIRILEKML